MNRFWLRIDILGERKRVNEVSESLGKEEKIFNYDKVVLGYIRLVVLMGLWF